MVAQDREPEASEQSGLVSRRELASMVTVLRGEMALVNAKADSFERLTEMQDRFLKEARGDAKEALDHRLEEMNNFRAQMGDQARTFVTKTEADSNLNRVAAEGRAEVSRLEAKLGVDEKDIAALQVYNSNEAAVIRSQATAQVRRAWMVGTGLAIAAIFVTLIVAWLSRGTPPIPVVPMLPVKP